AHLLVADELGYEAREDHRDRGLALGHALLELVVELLVRQAERAGRPRLALRERATERAPALHDVLELLAVLARVVERRDLVLEFRIRDRQLEQVAEDLELVAVHLLLLMGRV